MAGDSGRLQVAGGRWEVAVAGGIWYVVGRIWLKCRDLRALSHLAEMSRFTHFARHKMSATPGM